MKRADDDDGGGGGAGKIYLVRAKPETARNLRRSIDTFCLLLLINFSN